MHGDACVIFIPWWASASHMAHCHTVHLPLGALLSPCTPRVAQVVARITIYGRWAFLGDFDVGSVDEALGRERALLMPILLWAFTFFSTIMLVNLLIAQV